MPDVGLRVIFYECIADPRLASVNHLKRLTTTLSIGIFRGLLQCPPLLFRNFEDFRTPEQGKSWENWAADCLNAKLTLQLEMPFTILPLKDMAFILIAGSTQNVHGQQSDTSIACVICKSKEAAKSVWLKTHGPGFHKRTWSQAFPSFEPYPMGRSRQELDPWSTFISNDK